VPCREPPFRTRLVVARSRDPRQRLATEFTVIAFRDPAGAKARSLAHRGRDVPRQLYPETFVTRAIPFTKAKLRKALDVAKEKGFRLVVRLDGELVFEHDNNAQLEGEPIENNQEVVL
jgi:hypothetical protein